MASGYNTVKGIPFSLPADIVSEFVDNGSGHDMTGDYSVTPSTFSFQPAAGTRVLVHRFIVSILDSGSMDAGGYGNGSALTSGILARFENDSATIKDLCDGEPIKTNAAWGDFFYDVALGDWGAGANYIHVRCSFNKEGSPILLDGDNDNERLSFVMQDDFSHLTGHRINVKGRIL